VDGYGAHTNKPGTPAGEQGFRCTTAGLDPATGAPDPAADGVDPTSFNCATETAAPAGTAVTGTFTTQAANACDPLTMTLAVTGTGASGRTRAVLPLAMDCGNGPGAGSPGAGSPGAGPPGAKCAKGRHFDKRKHKCVKNSKPKTCKKGSRFDKRKHRCVKKSR
jgi:hypothetical protein